MNGASMMQPDPVRDAVLLALASYGGIAGLVVLLVSGLKAVLKAKVDGKEPVMSVILTYVLGCSAKFGLPGVYGGNDLKSWSLHLVILLVVAVGAKGIHDGVLNAFIKKEEAKKDGEEPK